ncbi:MAG: 1,4-butanediol diacrylate esterase [Rhodospirillales bacterium 20-64-7]|nr:MAG: 1,4-butanediol diacrylate esterase [Rhodospirillales bacterium 20-64-7]HQT76599.1 serine hydrolase domain-containing protein [Rhodopila sp.]
MSESINRVLTNPVESGKLPGVVGLVADDAGILYQGAFGRRAVDQPAPMTLDSVFRIASMTKAITATAAMQLIEAGRIGLEQPIGELLPFTRDVQVLEGFDAAGKPRLRAPAQPVTVRHLLTHTSGYGYDIFNADLGRYVAAAGLPSILTCRHDALKVPLLFDPGTRWEYGIGIDLAGRIVETVTGQDLDTYFHQHIFAPLGMTSSSFRPTEAMQARMVGTHARGPDGTVAPLSFEFPQDAEFLMGGGGLYSTAADYLAFCRMLLGGGTLDGQRVLKPETVRLMGQNHIGAIDVPKLRSDNPQMALEVEFFPGIVKKWGLSFLINMGDLPGGRAAGSLAWAGVHNTFFWVDPASRLTAVLMMQLLPANDPAVLETLMGFEGAVYGAFAR